MVPLARGSMCLVDESEIYIIYAYGSKLWEHSDFFLEISGPESLYS